MLLFYHYIIIVLLRITQINPKFSYILSLLTLRKGKTSFQCRAMDEHYLPVSDDDDDSLRLSTGFKSKVVNINSVVAVKVRLWDVLGQERFHTQSHGEYCGVHAVLLGFDLTDRASFATLERWLAQAKALVRADVPLVLIGMKSDQELARAVTRAEAEECAFLLI